MSAGAPETREPESRHRRGVAQVGLASFGSDSSHELVTSLLPGFLTATLHAGPSALGAIGLAQAVWQAALLRAIAWVSRGFRTPGPGHAAHEPRATTPVRLGERRRARGRQPRRARRPLLASLLVGLVGVRASMLLAFLPGLLAMVAISGAAREAGRGLRDGGARWSPAPSYLLLGFTPAAATWGMIAFVLAGSGTGLAETAENALIARQVPDPLRESGYGLLGLVRSAGDLGSSVVAGLLWSALSPGAAFAYAAAWMALCALSAPLLAHEGARTGRT